MKSFLSKAFVLTFYVFSMFTDYFRGSIVIIVMEICIEIISIIERSGSRTERQLFIVPFLKLRVLLILCFFQSKTLFEFNEFSCYRFQLANRVLSLKLAYYAFLIREIYIFLVFTFRGGGSRLAPPVV